ncbi:Twin-arginine translocation pathway signal [Lachnospiraceae bacterium TWA4]|nr:Twin-arginine translocation pathway signal [Lachnospiraceae bacterium TWA4]
MKGNGMENLWKEQPKEINMKTIEHKECVDLVIIGSGHAGTCAAREAAQLGASVIVIEQQNEEKQFILGMGEIGHINSKWQESHGVPKVDIDEFVEDWQKRTGNRSNYRLIRKYAKNCGETFDWFIEPLTEEEKNQIHPMFTPQSPNFPITLNGFHAYSGTPNMGPTLQNKAVKASQRIAKEHGARFFFETKACQLIKEENRVSGVIDK